MPLETINKTLDLANIIAGVGLVSVKIRFTTKIVSISFAIQGIKVEIEAEREALDLLIDDLKRMVQSEIFDVITADVKKALEELKGKK